MVDGDYAGEPLEGEDPSTRDVEDAVRWAREYAMLIRREAVALEAVLSRIDAGSASPELLLEQERHLRRAELLLSRLRFWNDRESALRETRACVTALSRSCADTTPVGARRS